MDEYSFGECPICRQGRLVGVKNLATGQVLIMCDDCESQWRSPNDAQSFKHALSDEVHCVGRATLDEIEAKGWVGVSLATGPVG